MLGTEPKENLTALIKTLQIKYKAGINETYVCKEVENFHRISVYRAAFQKGIPLLEQQKGTELDDLFTDALKQRLTVFDKGSRPSDTLLKLMSITAEEKENDHSLLGINPLDRLLICPTRGQLLLFMAKYGAGKSWFMIHTMREGVKQNKKVLYISLEMAENEVNLRLLQSLYAYRTKSISYKPKINVKNGTYQLLGPTDQAPRPNLHDSGEYEKVAELLLRDAAMEGRLLVKQFPTKGLSINLLNSYLDNLANNDNFVPDMIILDYADLMKPTKYKKETYEEQAQIYEELRGIAIERDVMMVTASQTNRGAGKGEKGENDYIDGADIAGAYAKLGTVDICLSFSQKEVERMFNLARLRVVKARNTQDSFEVCISQDYSIGQFVRGDNNLELNLETRAGYKQLVTELSKTK